MNPPYRPPGGGRPQPEHSFLQEPFEEKTDGDVFCLRRMEPITAADCQACFAAHEQLQAGYQRRSRCTEEHWVDIVAFLPSPAALWNTAARATHPFPNAGIGNPTPEERRPRWS